MTGLLDLRLCRDLKDRLSLMSAFRQYISGEKKPHLNTVEAAGPKSVFRDVSYILQ